MKHSDKGHINDSDRCKLVLGSGSPRRRQLFDLLGLAYEIKTTRVEEDYPEFLEPEEVALYLSALKAADIYCRLDDKSLLVTADTIVVKDQQILGKPKTIREARQMLHRLSGDWHEVITAVSIMHKEGIESFYDRTRVLFSQLNTSEINWYTCNNQVLDKAGAYGIQDWLGVCKIDRIEGNFYTVMGLPVHKLYRKLDSMRILNRQVSS